MVSRIALWVTRHWPFGIYGRIAWPVYLWLIGVGGPAFLRELYPDGIPLIPADVGGDSE